MESYVDSNLSLDEEVIYKAHASWASYLLVIAFDALLLIIGILFLTASLTDNYGNSGSSVFAWFLIITAVVIFGIVALTIRSTELALTNKRVIAKFGFLRETTIELRLDKIDIINVDRGILGRMFSYGSITFRGVVGIGTTVPLIKKPLAFRHAVYKYIDSRHSD